MLLKKQIPFVSSFSFHFYGTIRILSVNPTLLSLTHWPHTLVGPVRLTTKTHSGIFTAACRLTEYFQIFEKNSNVCMSRQFHPHLLRGSRPVILKYTQTPHVSHCPTIANKQEIHSSQLQNTQSRPRCPQSSYKHVEDIQAFNRLPRRLVNVHRLFHILAPGRRPALGLALGPALSRLRFPLCWPRSLSSSGTQVQPTATET